MLAPTYKRAAVKQKRKQTEDELATHHTQVNEIADVVAGALRCICDESVEGRSICCCQGSIGIPGSLNFDLCDDIADCSGGKELLDKADDIFLPSGVKLSEDSNCGVQ